MKMLEVIEFSPSFKRMSPAAVAFAIDKGAAKIDTMLSVSSYRTLQREGIHHPPQKLAEIAPELGYYFDLIGVGEDDDRVKTDHYEVYPHYDVHVDDNIEYGLTLLFSPDDAALFAADNTQFGDDEMPSMVWRYGPRDGLLLAQALDTFNDVPVNRGQVYHYGHREEMSVVEGIDFHTRDLTVNMTVPAYERG